MKKMFAIISALLVVGNAIAADTAAPSQPQTVCPVMGGKINKNLFVDHDGKRVYICCKGCLPKLKQAPAKYISQLEAKGIALDVAPKTAAADQK
jgi:hypothetical protein